MGRTRPDPWRGGSAPPLDLWNGAALPHEKLLPLEAARRLGLGMRPERWQEHATFRPTLTPWLVPQATLAGRSGARRRPLVIVAPGGAYVNLSPFEGPPVCRWLNKLGFHAGLLLYRQLRMHPAPLLDGRRAVQLVRNRSSEWHVDPSRILMLGFSAGGHLAGHVALAWNELAGRKTDAQLQAAGDAVAWQSARLAGAVLAYPVVSAHNDSVGTVGQGAFRCHAYHCVGRARWGSPRPLRHHASMEVLLGPRLGSTLPRGSEAAVSLEDLALTLPEPPPPFFVWHTEMDELVPSANAVRLAASLRERGDRRAVELHVFQGPNPPLRHGLGLAFERRLSSYAACAHDQRLCVGNWTALCAGWLRRTFRSIAAGRGASRTRHAPPPL